jgi:hypothetical protein
MPGEITRREERRGTRAILMWTAILGVCALTVVLVLTGVISMRMQNTARSTPPPAAPSTTTGQSGR